MAELLPPRLNALKSWLAKQIPVGNSKTAHQSLLDKPIAMLIWQYFNWVDRLIPPRPRKTNLWAGILSHSTHDVDFLNIAKISEVSERGDSLLPFLSRQPMECGYVDTPTKRGKGITWDDKDLALNAYDLHHLHFTPLTDSGRRPGDSNKLLFALVSRETITPVMVGDHKSFSDGSLFKAVASVRAEMGLKILGVTSPSKSDRFTWEESNRLTRAGCTTFSEVDGHVVPVALLTTAGTSLEHQRHVSRVMRCIHGWEEILDTPSRMRDAFQGARLPDSPAWAWRFHYGDLILEEG